jgi:hypothetical protein
MHVIDAGISERGGQLALGHTWFARQRRQADVDEDRNGLMA